MERTAALDALSNEDLRRVISSLRADIRELEAKKNEVIFEEVAKSSAHIGSRALMMNLRETEETSEADIVDLTWQLRMCASLSNIKLSNVKEVPPKNNISVLSGEGYSHRVPFTFGIHFRETNDKMKIVQLDLDVLGESPAIELKNWLEECKKSNNLSIFSTGMAQYGALDHRRYVSAEAIMSNPHFSVVRRKNMPGLDIEVLGENDETLLIVNWKIMWHDVKYKMIEDFSFMIDNEDSVFQNLVHRIMLSQSSTLNSFSDEDIVKFWNGIAYIVAGSSDPENAVINFTFQE